MFAVGDYVREKNADMSPICIIVMINVKLRLMEVRPPIGSTWIVTNMNKWCLFKEGGS
jgi:hypothetical protein